MKRRNCLFIFLFKKERLAKITEVTTLIRARNRVQSKIRVLRYESRPTKAQETNDYPSTDGTEISVPYELRPVLCLGGAVVVNNDRCSLQLVPIYTTVKIPTRPKCVLKDHLRPVHAKRCSLRDGRSCSPNCG